MVLMCRTAMDGVTTHDNADILVKVLNFPLLEPKHMGWSFEDEVLKDLVLNQSENYDPKWGQKSDLKRSTTRLKK